MRFLTYAALLDPEREGHTSHPALPPPTPEMLASYVGTYDLGPHAGITYPGLGLVFDKQGDFIKVVQV